MAQNKTTETEASVAKFLAAVKDPDRRKDCETLVTILKKLTKQEARMWGPSIVGFGSHHYVYDSGREGDSPNIAFSPRASSIALYLASGLENREALLAKLGKHKSEKACIHIKKLEDVDTAVLEKLFVNHVKHVTKLYPAKGKK